MDLARHLISGVDIWMNTPTRLAEASGTSGEKALMNGVLNFSVLDGWWYEGYRKDAGWALTDKRTYQNEQYQNQLDAEASIICWSMTSCHCITSMGGRTIRKTGSSISRTQSHKSLPILP